MSGGPTPRTNRPHVLFAILDWGMGHTTRTWPLIVSARRLGGGGDHRHAGHGRRPGSRPAWRNGTATTRKLRRPGGAHKPVTIGMALEATPGSHCRQIARLRPEYRRRAENAAFGCGRPSKQLRHHWPSSATTAMDARQRTRVRAVPAISPLPPAPEAGDVGVPHRWPRRVRLAHAFSAVWVHRPLEPVPGGGVCRPLRSIPGGGPMTLRSSSGSSVAPNLSGHGAGA